MNVYAFVEVSGMSAFFVFINCQTSGHSISSIVKTFHLTYLLRIHSERLRSNLPENRLLANYFSTEFRNPKY